MIQIHSKGIDLLSEEKEYIEKEIMKLLERSHHAEQEESIRVKVEVDKENISNRDHQFFCSITIDLPGKVLRAESHSGGVYSGVDDAIDSARRQMKKEKAKHVHI